MSRIIYFDNAATTMPKPPGVAQAITEALSAFGNVGRGVHGPAVEAGMAVLGARTKVADLLGAPGPKAISFTYNATYALNIAIEGLLPDGARALTTAASHNSVLRPLTRVAEERGCVLDVAPILPDASLDFEAYSRLLERSPHLVVITHASNLTGDVYDVACMAQMAHDAGAYVVLDAAQTAGALPVDMAALGVDVLCFTGHKSLMGPQGTGGLCVADGIEITPLIEGGTGTHSFDLRQPRFMPEALEGGTLNSHGLAGLSAGIDSLTAIGIETVSTYVHGLTERFVCCAAAIPGITIYGGRGGIDRCGIVALNVGETDAGTIADLLSRRWNICTRAGAHCAPLMHEALGTASQGAVRFSFSYLNTDEEVDVALDALRQLAAEFSA